MSDQSSVNKLKVIIESILFVADNPVPLSQLTRLAEATQDEISLAIDELATECQGRGLRIQHVGNAVQFVSAPETAAYVERFLGLGKRQHLSSTALETLAIIAYRQPISRAAVEKIRGVSCDHTLTTLKTRGLISEVDRSTSPGRPYLYGTTFYFLEHFGLERPEDLPPLAEAQADKSHHSDD